jgi:hypothetical protein
LKSAVGLSLSCASSSSRLSGPLSLSSVQHLFRPRIDDYNTTRETHQVQIFSTSGLMIHPKDQVKRKVAVLYFSNSRLHKTVSDRVSVDFRLTSYFTIFLYVSRFHYTIPKSTFTLSNGNFSNIPRSASLALDTVWDQIQRFQSSHSVSPIELLLILSLSTFFDAYKQLFICLPQANHSKLLQIGFVHHISAKSQLLKQHFTSDCAVLFLRSYVQVSFHFSTHFLTSLPILHAYLLIPKGDTRLSFDFGMVTLSI